MRQGGIGMLIQSEARTEGNKSYLTFLSVGPGSSIQTITGTNIFKMSI